MICEVVLYDLFMGFDCTVRVEFEITAWATPAVFDYLNGGDPASGPEWEVQEIGLTLNFDEGDGAEWLIDWRSKQWGLIVNSDDVVNAILEEINEQDECRPYKRATRAWRYS